MAEWRMCRFSGYEAMVTGSSKVWYCSCHSTVPGRLFSCTMRLSLDAALTGRVNNGDAEAAAARFTNRRRPIRCLDISRSPQSKLTDHELAAVSNLSSSPIIRAPDACFCSRYGPDAARTVYPGGA